MDQTMHRILIVDENQADLQVLRGTLEQHDPPYEVHDAKNSRDALWALKNHPFDVVAISTHLREGDALSVLRLIRDRGHDLPIILLGDVDNASTAVRAMAAGAADFISKRHIEGHFLTVRLQGVLEHHRLRRELTEQKTRLDEARARNLVNRMRTEFLANTSHELRTPLSAILGYSEILKDELGGQIADELWDFLCRLRENASHLLELVNSMLDYAGMITGDASGRPEEFRPADALDRMLKNVRPRAEKRSIRIRLSVEPEDLTMVGYAGRLQQLVFNLLDNAIKFSRPNAPGEVSVHVRLDGDEVRLTVRDKGIGIPEEDRDRIFEAFEQVDASPARKYGGLGLGLAVARALAQSMGGDLRLESHDGPGSLFLVNLPRSLGTAGEA